MLNYNLSLLFLIRLDYFLIFSCSKNHIRVVSEDPTLALDVQFGFLLIVHCNILHHCYQSYW